ncbi:MULTISPECIES: acyltransferase [unclassified Janthinobacterium]|uniref:acyltransferase n=1 Tax=unclassified Janthinobacterium TaxID=2610881 RepID=UPI000475AF68|nr:MULTISPECIES: DapH/DapD/GlmU-related protein [unclassified Janthinobacterium]MEC5159790.1 maltose O-acetyltransferase [Janthinobacterium sp. CG_S6]
MIRHLVNILLALLPPSRMFGLRRFLLRVARVQLAQGVSFCGRAWIYGRGTLSIGADTWLSPGVQVHTHLDAAVVLGARCDIGPQVTFITGGHVVGDGARRAGAGTAAPITVGDGCWIGAGSLILGGVTIGAGAVVAAGSVVTRDVPANVLAAGVPARVKKSLA